MNAEDTLNTADTTNTESADQAIKSRMKAIWEDGDYATFARFMERGAIEILESWQLAPGQRLLDVGCGSGQTAIPAAHRGHKVTGIDVAANLITYAQSRARDDNLMVRFDVGDAEELPYPAASFDVGISLIGAMFAPNPEKVVAEFARVIRPGGRLCMANWTPRGMPAQMFKCLSAYVAPPEGLIPPVLWGDEETVLERLEKDFTDIQLKRKFYPQWYFDGTASELVEYFRAWFGPVKRTFEAIDPRQGECLHGELAQIYRDNGCYEKGRLAITGGEFLEVLATRRNA